MKSFKSHLNEAKPNLHMTHMEDSMYIDGYAGFRNALCIATNVLHTLSGSSTSSVNITTKFDGCVHADTIVLTDRGEMTIEKLHHIVESGEYICVMGQDQTHNVNINKFADVHNSYIHDDTLKQWVEVQTCDGSIIKLTSDHEVHTTNRGWVTAGELVEGDDITELS